MRRNGESGFTLIELVMTAVLMSITFLAIYSLFDTLRIVNRRADNLTVATEVAQQQLELYRNKPYSTLAVGTTDIASSLAPYPSLGPDRKGNVTVASVDGRGLKRVDINLDYSDRGIVKKVRLTTLVAQNGLNR